MSSFEGQQFGNYRLIRLIGEGSFSEVYLGKHAYLNIDTQFAIKVLRDTHLSQDERQSFLKEARIVAKLEHPNIVKIHDFGIENENGIPYIVMYFAPNGNLRERYPKGNRLPLSDIVRYVNQIADALQYAHDRKIIHRDIKPENILLGQSGKILLSDFGTALTLPGTHAQLTEQVAGTISYMAPEQFKGKTHIASDQYALGVIVYEWLCGSRPFQGNAFEVSNQHLYASPPPLREKVLNIPGAIEVAILTSLQKEPALRYGSVRAFANALEIAYQLLSPEESFPASHPSSYLSPSGERTLTAPTEPVPFIYSASKREQEEVTPSDTYQTAFVSDEKVSTGEAVPSADPSFATLPVSPEEHNSVPDSLLAVFSEKELEVDAGVQHVEEADIGSILKSILPGISLPVEDADQNVEEEQRGEGSQANFEASPDPSTADSYMTRSLDRHEGSLADSYMTRSLDVSGNLSADSYATRALDPTKEDWLEKGDNYEAVKEYNKALDCYKRALELDSRYAPAYTSRGRVLQKMRNHKDALIAFSESLRINPENAAVWRTKIDILYRFKRYDEALEASSHALELSQDNALIWLTRGKILHRLASYNEALNAYDKALEIIPRNSSALVWFAKVEALFTLGKYEEALVACDKALAIKPKKAHLWIMRGEALYKLGRDQEALEAYKRASAYKPHNTSIAQQIRMLSDLIRERAFQPSRSDDSDEPFSVASDDKTVQRISQMGEKTQKARRPAGSPGKPDHRNEESRQERRKDTHVYDVYLSHSDVAPDIEWVEQLAKRLEDEEGFRVWLDKWKLIPGTSEQHGKVQGIDQCQCCAVCLSEQTPLGWFQREIERALKKQQNDQNFSVIPVFMPGAKNVDDMLELNVWADFRTDPDYAFYVLVCGVRKVPVGRWPQPNEAETSRIFTDTEDRLRNLAQLRQDKLVDDHVAVEFQRIVLERYWLEPSNGKDHANE